MIRTSTGNTIFTRISATAVVIALVTLSIIQYRWVVSSAEKNLTELYRSYAFRIQGTISEKFSLFPLLGDRRSFFDDIENEEELHQVIEDYFNSDSLTNGYRYLQSISYINESPNGKNYNIYSVTGWELNQQIPDYLDMEQRGMNLIPDSSDKGHVWINIPNPPYIRDQRLTVFFKIDILSFYHNEIETSQLDNSGNYQLKWYYDSADDFHRLDDKQYHYSPLRVIKDTIFSTQKPWLIEIPLHVILFNERENKLLKVFYDRERPPQGDLSLPMVYVDVLSEGKSLIKTKEYDLTLQWIMSLLLIMGIGIAYIVILFQISRLKIMRKREKEFVATVTHELRTPLTVINAAADNIKSGIISPERMEQYGNLITDQSTRLSSMIEGILLFSRLEGKAEQIPHTHQVIFSDIEENLSIYSRSLEQNYNRRISIDFASLPREALSHRETIELIVSNLISNSAKHAYDREITGEIRVRGHIKLPRTLVFTVEDDGSGIEKSESRHIFEPFFRGEKSMKEQIKGSGLGLYLSMRKAKLIGGDLKLISPYERVDGRIRKGSRFILSIPYYPLINEADRV